MNGQHYTAETVVVWPKVYEETSRHCYRTGNALFTFGERSEDLLEFLVFTFDDLEEKNENHDIKQFDFS
jgi:hypothetical protein